MRRTNYTVRDLMDTLRSKDVFDIGEVAYAILETNGTVSVLEKGAYQPPTRQDLHLEPTGGALSHLLVLEGKIEQSGLRSLHLSREEVITMLRSQSVALKSVFFAQMNGDGEVHVQLDRAHGSKTKTFRYANGSGR